MNESPKKPFYITTTLPYVNAPLHIGHALEFVRADTIARYKKLTGHEVFFNSGTDEHGIKILKKAEENNVEVKTFVDQAFDTFKNQISQFGLLEDIHFERTTEASHEEAAQEFWRLVDKAGFIYKKSYTAKYCASCEEEKTDSQLNEKGECLEHPGKPVETIDEENYFFKYSAFQDKLLAFYDEHPNFIIPDTRYNEIKTFVKSGLRDFSISRLKSKMSWGVPVPGDEDHVMYVWFDALTSYISGLGWPTDKEGNYKKYWEEAVRVQYCGKDNTRFQGAMWQAMLIAAGLPNSDHIVVNGHITAEGGVKMSKSLGNVVDPLEIANTYGTDALRYFLLREINAFEDSPFTMERFKDSYNSGLANGLGNLTSRIMKMAESNNVSVPEGGEIYFGINQPAVESLDRFNVSEYMSEIWSDIQNLDGYIQKNEPFKKIKVDEEAGKKDIQYLLTHLRGIALRLEPVMPETSQKIQDLIKSNKIPETPLFARLETK